MMSFVSKTFSWLTVFFCFLSAAMAQGGNEPETLIGKKYDSGTIGFSVAPGYAFTLMDQTAASLFTLRGGVTFGDALTIGGFYNVSLNQMVPQSETISNIYMDYWAAGGMLEYTLLSGKLIHLTFPVSVGIGEVEMDNEAGSAGLGEASFLVVEPAALLEVNLHKYARLNIGGGYRLVGNMAYRNFDQSAISGFSGNIGLRFGLFR